MAENPVGNLLVRLDFDGSRFERGITAAKRELASYGKAVDSSTKFAKDQNYSMKSTNDALHNMRTRYQGLNGALKQTQSIMSKLDAEGKRGTDQWARRNVEAQDYQRQMYYLNEEYKEMQRQSYLANSSFTKLGNGLQRTSQIMNAVGGAFQQVGGAITQVGAVATAGGTLFVKQAMDFEKGMISVQKTTNASAEQMVVFTEGIRGLAREMPIAHGELAELAATAGQLGVAQDDLLEFTETMAMVGTATSLTAGQASEAFARFTNITGTGVTTIDNLGSALVHLGNSYATTETEIMSLATMLVGTLSSLGVSESQILGLSAAMSSLGITAERGGSSMSKFFSEMASAVSEGGESLQEFAGIAGMTGDAFATMFESDPMSALEAFIDGMVRLEGEGQSFVKTLDDMGIKEVRLRDTLLRLAGGHEILNSALIDSANAYGEATALQQEYDLMMQSTAAQWEVAKNKMVDVAIEIGGHLLPVIIDLLNQSDGLISMAQDVAQWFGNLDDGVKRNIVTWGAMSVPIGAVLTGFGSLITAGGSIVGLLGNISKGMGRLSLATLEAFGFIKDIDGGATTVIGTLLKLNPAILGVVGGLALVGGGIWVWNEMTKDIRAAKQAVEDFPSIEGITAEQAESLRDTAGAFAEIDVALESLGSSSSTHAGTITSAISEIVDEIEDLGNKDIDGLTDTLSSLPTEVAEAIRGGLEEAMAGTEQVMERAREIEEEIQGIYDRAEAQQRELSESEITRVRSLNDELKALYSETLGHSFEQQQQIYSQLLEGLDGMSQTQLEARRDAISNYMETEKSNFESHKAELNRLYAEGLIDESALNQGMQVLETNFETSSRNLEIAMVRTFAELAERAGLKGNELLQAVTQSMAQFGNYSMDDIVRLMQTETGKLTSAIDNMLIPLESAPNEIRNASNEWNESMEFLAEALETTIDGLDLSTVEIDDFVTAMNNADMSWAELELIRKEANIDDNMKEFIDKVVEANGGWDSVLALDDKELNLEVVTKGEEAMRNIIDTLGFEWNDFEAKVQELSVKYEGGELIEEAIWALNEFQHLTVDQKLAIVRTQINNDEIYAGIQNLYELGEIDESDLSKFIAIDTNSSTAEGEVRSLLESWGIVPPEDIKLLSTETNAVDTMSSLGSLVGYWLLSMIGLPSATLDAEDNVTPAVETATGEVISFGEESGEAQLGANVEPVTSAVSAGVGAVQELDSTTADVQTSTNAEQGVTRPTDTARMAVNNLDRSSASPVAKLVDYASATIQTVRNRLWSLDGRTANTYVYTHYRATGSMSRRKHGTPYHQGGMAILGDGGKHEPYLTPQGYFGVSPDVDTPVNLPMGSKVWSSINKFKQEAMGNDLLRPLVDQIPRLSANLPKYATGTDKSFLDELTKMRVPKDNNVMNTQQQSTGDVYNFNIELQAIGTKLTSSQADGIIEPIIKSAERYGKKKGIKVNVGRS